MKKIKILNYLVITLILINATWFIRYIYYQPSVFKAFYGEEKIQNHSPYGDTSFLLSMSFYLLFLFGLFFIQKGLYTIIQKGFFNDKSILLFRKGGLFFIISSLPNFIIHVVLPMLKGRDFFKMFIGNDFLILTIGLGLFLIADLIKDGSLLKQENDLTI